MSREQGNGALRFFIRRLRVSCLLDRRAVSGSKSDSPTMAKNCEAMIVRWAGKSKGFKGIMEEEEWELEILDSGCLILDP